MITLCKTCPLQKKNRGNVPRRLETKPAECYVTQRWGTRGKGVFRSESKGSARDSIKERELEDYQTERSQFEIGGKESPGLLRRFKGRAAAEG